MDADFDIGLIIPFLNEEHGIPKLVEALNDEFKILEEKNLTGQIIFVDDGSTDNSYKILMDAKHVNYSAKIIRLSKNYGSHAAIRAGLLHSKAKFTTFMAADLQEPFSLIYKLYQLCKKDHDIVWAARSSVSISFFDKITSRFFALLMRRFAFPSYPKKGFDMAMFNSQIKNHLNQNIESNSSIHLQIFSLGFNQATLYYNKAERKVGKSKWTLSKKFKLFIDSFIAFSYAPIRFITTVGVFMFITGVIWTFYIVLRELIKGDLAQGWPTLSSILLIGFGVTNIALGIIAEYLWRTLDAARKRPVFIIKDVTKITGE
ncbi:MAG: glycosyltransferase [Cyclobacteriaceae bacterium]